MPEANVVRINRREMLGAISGVMAGLAWTSRAHASDLPPVTAPRATSGDTAAAPAWEKRLTITVGPGPADIAGGSEKAIQAAVDYVARLGGGTVQILPGAYRLRNAVYLASGVRLMGSGEESVLIKEPSVETTLAADSDWYDQEITLRDAAGFEIGDGVCLQTENPHDGGQVVVKRTLVARSGNRFKLDRALRDNFWMEKEPTVSTLFPLLTAENASDITIENLTLDGNRANNAFLNGNYAGCIWIQDCSRIAIRGVTARNGNGDGISFQVCHDVSIEHCHSHGHAGLGMHPGSGAQRPVLRDNLIEGNQIGLFFCWGVKYGLAEKNTIRNNETGISIGHRDNENLVCGNDIAQNTKVGVLFRPERGEGYTAAGNRFERNRIADNGGEEDAAVDIKGVTAGNFIVNNEIRETRGPAARIGVRLGAESGENTIENNRIEGFATPIKDLRAAKQNQ